MHPEPLALHKRMVDRIANNNRRELQALKKRSALKVI